MKTIEEKAKAYDEIIERAKTMLAAGEVMYGKENNASQLITDLIPELAESEDERIRNEIRDFIVGELGVATPMERHHKWLAYLERQKEQKPVTDGCMMAEKQDYSGLTEFERTIHRGFLCAGVKNVPVGIIKETAQDCLAQQKAEWNSVDEACRDTILCAVQGKFVTEAALTQAISWFKALGPVKPVEWSEEDTLMITTIIQTLERFGGRGTTGMQIDWLKSLRPQSKTAEWSEEDETRRTNAIVLLQTPILRKVYQQSEIDKAVEWLRNLRPQPHLKPSRAQMSMLYEVINEPNNASSESCLSPNSTKN